MAYCPFSDDTSPNDFIEYTDWCPASLDNFWSAGLTLTDHVDYTRYSFLIINNLRCLSQEDIAVLQLQGCLQLPNRRITDELIRQYFMHVHPMLPLLSESHFWRVYCRPESEFGTESEKIPLLLFWAMLFASCGRLFDLDTESSPIVMAQSALLLTFWSVPSKPAPFGPNTMWLKIAIHYAQMVNAHHACLPNASPTRPGNAQGPLMRLWWCCIIRDRSLSLGLRRSLQISKLYQVPDYIDFQEEIHSSKVYDPTTKQILTRILVHFMDLCMILTDLLIVSSQEDYHYQLSKGRNEVMGRLSACRIALQSWHDRMNLEFPTSNENKEFYHNSVIIHVNMTHIYYNAAMLTLHQWEILFDACSPAATAHSVSLHTSPSKQTEQVEEAALSIADRLTELMQLGLIPCAPDSSLGPSLTDIPRQEGPNAQSDADPPDKPGQDRPTPNVTCIEQDNPFEANTASFDDFLAVLEATTKESEGSSANSMQFSDSVSRNGMQDELEYLLPGNSEVYLQASHFSEIPEFSWMSDNFLEFASEGGSETLNMTPSLDSVLKTAERASTNENPPVGDV
ncbi:unnamed protein product [Clonostachys byssicola]|uniref:Transcription factor domain-containing protein n=1 Tax=Clonostachys byssicola TaxID=160290 RepID=A0A9N9XWC2_9HYPO|nr:unnamed protein product [Clonostachys byssicola]